MMARIIRDEYQIGRFCLRQIADTPGIDLNDRPGVLDLDTRVNDRCEHDITTLGVNAV